MAQVSSDARYKTLEAYNEKKMDAHSEFDVANKILDSIDGVFGEIYKITNTTNNKCYVGQTRSHRLNHGRYRPFGSIGRFKDHISEAVCNTKTKQCSYLNSAIRKYGQINFRVEVLERCHLQDLNDLEIKWIHTLQTVFPNGYNLTRGGKTTEVVEYDTSIKAPPIYERKGRRSFQSPETRDKISSRLREVMCNPDKRAKQASRTQLQHFQGKLERFSSAEVDLSMIHTYLKPLNQARYVGYRVVIDDNRADFIFKRHNDPTVAAQQLETLREKAFNFLKELHMRQEHGKNLLGLDNSQPSSLPSTTAEAGEGSETKWVSVTNEGLASPR